MLVKLSIEDDGKTRSCEAVLDKPEHVDRFILELERARDALKHKEN